MGPYPHWRRCCCFCWSGDGMSCNKNDADDSKRLDQDRYSCSYVPAKEILNIQNTSVPVARGPSSDGFIHNCAVRGAPGIELRGHPQREAVGKRRAKKIKRASRHRPLTCTKFLLAGHRPSPSPSAA